MSLQLPIGKPNPPIIAEASSSPISLFESNVRIHEVLKDPFVTLVDGLCTPDECAYLRDLALPKLAPSRVVSTTFSESRTSTSCRLPRTDRVLSTILKRVCYLLSLDDTANIEPVQLLRYDPNQEYKNHFDFFNEQDPDYKENVKRGGNRCFTIFVYLNNVQEGGATAFPILNMKFSPREGSGVFWSNENNGMVDKRMLHAGERVISGEKWGLNIWIRKGKWVQPTDPVETKVLATNETE